MAKKTKIDLMQLDEIKGHDGSSQDSVPVESKAKIGKKTLLIYGMAGLVLLGGGAGGAGYLGWVDIPGLSTPKKEESPEAKKQEVGPTVKLSPLTVNLKEESGHHYLKATVVLEIEKKHLAEEIQSRMSPLTDMVILTLSDKRLEELKRPESMESIKKELLAKMNQYLDPQKIRQIYFDEFIYQ
jgi:flagellar protein FliL